MARPEPPDPPTETPVVAGPLLIRVFLPTFALGSSFFLGSVFDMVASVLSTLAATAGGAGGGGYTVLEHTVLFSFFYFGMLRPEPFEDPVIVEAPGSFLIL